MKPLLGLAMIVKDESAGIVETLRSIEPFIDYWTILDTGSTDGTQELVKQTLGNRPGQLIEEPFVDFATSRNRAFELHGDKTQFVIMLSGDDRLVNGRQVRDGDRGLLSIRVEALRAFLAKASGNAFNIERLLGTTRYQQTVVIRAGAGWLYKGRTHEVLIGPDGQVATELIPNVSIETVGKPQNKTARWRLDLELLHEDMAVDPTNARSAFYLAQTYECLGQLDSALAAYEARLKLTGWHDEAYEAAFRRARVMGLLDKPWPEVQHAYLEAFALEPSRAEPLFAIAKHYYDHGRHYGPCYVFASAAAKMPRPQTRLFIDDEVYAWKALDLAAIAAYHLAMRGRPDLLEPGRQAAFAALAMRPDDLRLRQNVAFYMQSTIVS